MADQQVYDVDGAALAYDTSPSTIRRAVNKAVDDGKFPPPLKAKRKGTHDKAALSFHRKALDEWFERWPDAG